MPCDACRPEAGKLISTDRLGRCIHCGNDLTLVPYHPDPQERWDKYFHNICEAIATKSPCMSRKIGAILVRDKSIVSTGYNGPARGYPHCNDESDICPRKKLGFKSGEGLEYCPASHAEMNAVANAARIGASTVGTTLYMNCIIPCKFCAVILVNAGIEEIVVDELSLYHEMSNRVFERAHTIIRTFEV